MHLVVVVAQLSRLLLQLPRGHHVLKDLIHIEVLEKVAALPEFGMTCWIEFLQKTKTDYFLRRFVWWKEAKAHFGRKRSIWG
jgi:hypothetical protein